MVFIHYISSFFSSSDDSAKASENSNSNLPFTDRLAYWLKTSLSVWEARHCCDVVVFFRSSKLCCTGAEMSSATRYMLRRNTASIMTI